MKEMGKETYGCLPARETVEDAGLLGGTLDLAAVAEAVVGRVDVLLPNVDRVLEGLVTLGRAVEECLDEVVEVREERGGRAEVALESVPLRSEVVAVVVGVLEVVGREELRGPVFMRLPVRFA